MCARSTEMPQKYRLLYSAVLEVLKTQGCVTNYVIERHDVRIEWAEDGFDRAFEEFKVRPRSPFGLKSKDKSATFMLVLAKHEKKKVLDDYLVSEIKARYDLP